MCGGAGIRGLLGALALMLAVAPAAQAATISVPPGTADTNATCSASPCPNLRAAIAYANANPGTTISLAAGTYALSIDELKLTADATVIGQGAAQTKIQQTGSGFRVLEIPGSVSGAPTVTLQNLKITGGNVTVPLAMPYSDYMGGGIRDEAASLTLQGVAVDGNQIVGADGTTFGVNGQGQDAAGGGIAIPYSPPGSISYTRSLAIYDSTISGNTAQGGNGGPTTLSGSSDTAGFGGGGIGGGIYTGQRSSLLIQNSTLQGNHAFGGTGGGDTYNGPPPQFSNAGDGGSAYGGAIAAEQHLMLLNDTVAGNVATGGQPGPDANSDANVGTGGDAYGAAIAPVINSGNNVDIESSTISGNAVAGGSSPLGAMNPGPPGAATGGGIQVFPGSVTIDASTLAGNTSSGGLGSGGASGGGNIDVSGGTLYLEDSIVSAGTVAPGPSSSGGNCRTENGGTITDQTHNLEDTTPSQCGLSSANHDVIGADPLLGPLADNGGPTQTRALGAGSPAIGVGECFASTDQRGQPRPSGGPCDIGAYETQPGGGTPGGGTPGGGTPGGGTPGGGTPGGGTPGGGTPAPGSPKLPGQQPVASADGSVKVIVACAGAGACTGTLQLTVTKLGGAYSARSGHRAGRQVVAIGSARFRIAAGHSAAVSVRLSSLGRRLLRARPHGLAVTGRISISGSKATVSRRLMLQPAHRSRRRR